MNPLGTRARVQELARLLEGAVSGPTSLTAGHAALAMRLGAVAPALDARAVPRTEFRAALRTRLVAVATVQAATLADAPALAGSSKALDAAVSWTQSRKAQRRIGATAGAMAGVIAFTGVGIAASRSLPGQPFYGLKRGAEGLQLDLVSGDTAKGSKHLEFAETRLREVRALAHGDGELSLGGPAGTPLAAGLTFGGTLHKRINDTLTAFNNETNSGRALLEHAYRANGKEAPLRLLKSFASDSQATLVAILPALPAASRDSAETSLQLVSDVSSTVNQLLSIGTCGGSCFPQAGGPTLPTEPVPTPGATATPTQATDNNNVPVCTCVTPTKAPEPTPATAPTPEQTPTSEPTTEPTPTDTPTPGPLLPTALTSLLPTPIQSLLPTSLPLLPTPLPTLPSALATLLPSLPPVP